MAAYLGCTLEIETRNDKFEGVLIDIETGNKRFTLSKVKVLSTGKKLRTPCHFYGNEVLELRVINPVKKKQSKSSDTTQTSLDKSKASTPTEDVLPNSTPGPDTEGGSLIHRTAENSKDHGQRKLQQRDPRESASVEETVTSQREIAAEPLQTRSHVDELTSSSSYHMNSWQELKKKTASSKGYILIDKIDSDFRKVMQHLKQQRFIGLAVGGVNIGRRGDLHIVQIYADIMTYIFDVKSLGTALFNYERGGLGEVLESHSIVKVMHDCRWVSDLLHHRYGIQLNCIYDTQVTDILVRRQEKGGETPRNSRALAECLLEYLEISISEVYTKIIHRSLDMEEKLLWETRPLNPDLLTSSVRDVRYLLDLRVATLRRLMGELMCATHIYLTSVRDTPESRTSRGQDPSLVPYGLTNLFRRGLRGMSHAYEEFQFASVGEGGGKSSSSGAVPWDLWQPGQQLNHSLHKTNQQGQFSDATAANTENQVTTCGDKQSQHEPVLSGATGVPDTNANLTNGMPAGDEEEGSSDSDSDEEDVFGGGDVSYAWRRKPTLECDQQELPDNRSPPALPDKVDVNTQACKVISSSGNMTVQSNHKVIKNNAETYQKDQHLYKNPIVTCATDLYNLPVNGIETSSTDDDSAVDYSTEEGTEESGISTSGNKEDATLPFQWPVVETSASDLVARPAGMENSTLFEALPSGNEMSPLRSNRNPSTAETRHPTSDSKIALSAATNASREGSPLSIPDLEEDTCNADQDDHDHVNGEGAAEQVDSHSFVKSEIPFAPSACKDAPLDLVYSESKCSGSFYTPKGPVSNNKMRKPDKMHYTPPRMRDTPPRMRDTPPRMRDIPPRFRKACSASAAINHGNALDVSEPYVAHNFQSTVVDSQNVSDGSAESGSESTSSSTSSGSNRLMSNNASTSVRVNSRSNQGSPSLHGQNRSSPTALSRPATFGEMMAHLSDTNQRRAYDSARNNYAAGGGATCAPSGGDRASSSESEDLGPGISRYDEMIAGRVASGTSCIGKGRARALTVSVNQQPALRNPKNSMTTLSGHEVRMDYPSEYEIQNAPKAIPIRADLHLLSMKTIGRGGRF